jgi:hypothetical protein
MLDIRHAGRHSGTLRLERTEHTAYDAGRVARQPRGMRLNAREKRRYRKGFSADFNLRACRALGVQDACWRVSLDECYLRAWTNSA